MAVIEGPVSGNKAEVDANFNAVRITERPMDVGSGGAYRMAMASGLMTGASLTAAIPVFAFRWGSTTKTAIVSYVYGALVATTDVTAAQEVGLQAFIARSFTASDTAGTAATLTGNSFKKRTSHATTAVTDIRIGSTASLTAGTRTLDAQPFLDSRAWDLATAATVPHNVIPIEFDARNPGTYPIVFAQDEGFEMNLPIALTTSGTFRLFVAVEWFEVVTASLPYGA
jgi:hypothetical protein